MDDDLDLLSRKMMRLCLKYQIFPVHSIYVSVDDMIFRIQLVTEDVPEIAFLKACIIAEAQPFRVVFNVMRQREEPKQLPPASEPKLLNPPPPVTWRCSVQNLTSGRLYRMEKDIASDS